MWKKVLISGAVGAAILAAGGTALAASGAGSPSPAPATTSSGQTAHAGHPEAALRVRAVLRRTLHATWTTGRDGSFTTHDAIRGTVTAVSPSSVTVRAADGTSETYAVTPSTKVRDKGALKTTVSITSVHTGDTAAVLGTGTGSLTATQIVDAPKS